MVQQAHVAVGNHCKSKRDDEPIKTQAQLYSALARYIVSGLSFFANNP
jgi:hypothetical protein